MARNSFFGIKMISIDICPSVEKYSCGDEQSSLETVKVATYVFSFPNQIIQCKMHEKFIDGKKEDDVATETSKSSIHPARTIIAHREGHVWAKFDVCLSLCSYIESYHWLLILPFNGHFHVLVSQKSSLLSFESSSLGVPSIWHQFNDWNDITERRHRSPSIFHPVSSH